MDLGYQNHNEDKNIRSKCHSDNTLQDDDNDLHQKLIGDDFENIVDVFF